MPKPQRKKLNIKQNALKDALIDSKGDLKKAFAASGVSIKRHENWMVANPNYADMIETFLIDEATHAARKLRENVEKNSQAAIEYQLNHKGDSLGYGSARHNKINHELRVHQNHSEKELGVLDSIIVYMDFNHSMKALGMEQYEFVKFVNKSKTFRASVFQQIHRMLLLSYDQVGKSEENHKATRLERWLDVLNDDMSFSTATMMYVDILNGTDSYTFNEEFWISAEGVKIASSLREHIVDRMDYMLFCRLYFKRVLKKELKLMPFHSVLARFYMMVFNSDRKRFICNMPVRHGKSEFLDALIFFFYFMDPASVILHSAYGDTVLKPMRNRIETALNIDPFFKSLMKIQPTGMRFNTTDFTTTAGGNYLQFTINGQVTGRGGNALDPTEKGMLALDDVNAPKWKGTQHMINSNEIVTNTLLSRIPHMALLNVQQRIDDGDLTGYLLENSNANPPESQEYRLLILYIPFDKNEVTDTHYNELKRKYPNVDFYGYEEMPYGVINPSMAHYAVKETCPEAWHIYLTQYQQIPTESADKLFHGNMLLECRRNEIGVDATTGHLVYVDRREDGTVHTMLLTLLFHVDTTQLSEDTEGSDYNVISVIGVGVDQKQGLKRCIMFEQIQEQDIGIKQYESSFKSVAAKWLSIFPKNDIRLAVEEKSAGSVAKTVAEDVISKLVTEYNVQSAVSIELKRPPGENKRFRGEQASQSLERYQWFRYYPYDLAKGLDTRFTDHGKLQTTDSNHWWHETRYEIINFTGRESSTIHDDCCEALFDVANKMILDGGLWREYVTYSTRQINEHNLVQG